MEHSNNELAALAAELPDASRDIRQFANRETVFLQGSPSLGAWVVLDGQVELNRTTSQGHRVMLFQARVDESFAEAAIFSDSYHCDAIARADCRLMLIRRNAVLQAIEHDAALAAQLCLLLARQVRDYRHQVEIVSIRGADDRVYQAMLAGLMTSNIKQFSARIGLTHEAVYRSLARLTRSGKVIRSARGAYEVATATNQE